jgi:hypothetical protein
MKFATSLFAAAMLLATPVLADDIPQLSGTWKGKSESISLQGGYGAAADVTLVVSEQKGRVFKGEITYVRQGQSITEPVVGAIDSDGERVFIVGDEGHHAAEYDDGVLEDCYVSGEHGIAVCLDLKKQ